MSISTSTVTTIDLAGGTPLALEPMRGGTLRVLHGVAWLTMDGDADDRILRAGDEAALRARPSMVEGLGAVTLQIVEPGPERNASRSAGWRRMLQHARQWVTRLQWGPDGGHACA